MSSHSFIYCSFAIYLSNLLVNFRRKNICSVWKSYHQQHSQVAGVSIFVFTCCDVMECGKNCDTKPRNTDLPLDIQKTTDFRRKCARHLRGRCSRSVFTYWTRLLHIFEFFFLSLLLVFVLLKWTYRPVYVVRLMWQSQDRQLSPQCSGTGIVAEGSGHLGYDAALLGELVPTLRNIIVPSKTAPLQMKTLRSFETPETTNPTTEPYVPEDLNPARYRGTECW